MRFAFSLLLSMALATSLHAQPAIPELPPPPINPTQSAAELGAALDSYIRALADSGRFSGDVLVAKDGKPIFERAYGFADRANKVPNAPSTRFNLGSINKAFTKSAIMQLAAAHKLALTDTLGALLPDYPNEQAKRATVQQLLDHQGGIPDFFGPAFDAAPKDQFRTNADYYRFVSKQPQLFEPGARRQYCNGCYIVLGAIVEKVSGTKYEDYIRDHVYAPAGMKTAGPLQTDAIEPNVAMGYTTQWSDKEDGPVHTNVFTRGASGSAAGGGYATAADLLAFDNAMREHKLLADEQLASWFGWDSAAVKMPRARGGYGIAGGAPGINAALNANGEWTVIVMGNIDPPSAMALASAVMKQLAAPRS